ncbi:MAG: hypothetical protein AAFX94_17755 [Myxococcota bacterium]
MLSAFIALGLILEALLAFKVGAYLDEAAELRREMWTLAHAHGTLLSLVHIAFAAYVKNRSFDAAPFVSVALFLAVVLMPVGFLLAGAFPYEGDPGSGIWLVPLGGVSLLSGSVAVAWDSLR